MLTSNTCSSCVICISVNSAPTSTPSPPPDKSMNLNQLLIQLQEVEPHWMALGQTVGLNEELLESVKSQVSQTLFASSLIGVILALVVVWQ